MTEKLTPKQALFIAEYELDLNATRAALAVGVPAKSAAVTGSRWVKKFARIVEQRQAQRAAKLEITADRVLQEIAKLAYYDPGKLYDENGRMKPVHQLDDMTRAAISSVDVEETETSTTTKKVKMADKGQNLERLGRYLKLFTDKVEHDGRITLEQLVSGHGKSGTDGGLEEDQRVA